MTAIDLLNRFEEPRVGLDEIVQSVSHSLVNRQHLGQTTQLEHSHCLLVDSDKRDARTVLFGCPVGLNDAGHAGAVHLRHAREINQEATASADALEKQLPGRCRVIEIKRPVKADDLRIGSTVAFMLARHGHIFPLGLGKPNFLDFHDGAQA